MKKNKLANPEEEQEKVSPASRSLRQFIRSFFYSFWPDNYHMFTNKRLSHAVSYILTLLIIAFVLTSLLFMVDIAQIQDRLTTEIEKIDELEVGLNFNLTEPIVLPEHNVIVMSKRNYTDENLLINENGIYRKSLSCMVLGRLCVSNKPKAVEFSDLEDTEYLLKLVRDILYLLLPVFLVAYFVLYILKYMFLIVLFAIVAYLVVLLARYRFPFRKSLNAAIYSSTIMIVLDLVKLDFVSFYFIPVLAYVVLFGLSIVLVSEKKKKIF